MPLLPHFTRFLPVVAVVVVVVVVIVIKAAADGSRLAMLDCEGWIVGSFGVSVAFSKSSLVGAGVGGIGPLSFCCSEPVAESLGFALFIPSLATLLNSGREYIDWTLASLSSEVVDEDAESIEVYQNLL